MQLTKYCFIFVREHFGPVSKIVSRRKKAHWVGRRQLIAEDTTRRPEAVSDTRLSHSA